MPVLQLEQHLGRSFSLRRGRRVAEWEQRQRQKRVAAREEGALAPTRHSASTTRNRCAPTRREQMCSCKAGTECLVGAECQRHGPLEQGIGTSAGMHIDNRAGTETIEQGSHMDKREQEE